MRFCDSRWDQLVVTSICVFAIRQVIKCTKVFFKEKTYNKKKYITLHRLGVLAANGFCRPFDQDASGYSRAEAISVLLLQRRKDAKRVYANLIYSKSNCDGFKNEGLHYPSGHLQMKLLREFYEDINMSPSSVNYVEAHSTGTIAGDA